MSNRLERAKQDYSASKQPAGWFQHEIIRQEKKTPAMRTFLRRLWQKMAEDTAANKRTRSCPAATWSGVVIAAAIFVALAWFVGALFGQP